MFNKILFLAFAVGCCANYVPQHIRPCHLNDLNCIRNNLAANSKCNRNVRGSIPSQYITKQFRFETPYFNASYIDNDLVTRNHDKCRVSEFFYNVKKDLAVLSVDCPGLVLSSNRTLVQHYSLREDTAYSFRSTWKYPLIRLTANIRNADVMDLCKAFVFTDVAVMPTFIVSPNDPKTNRFLSRDLSFLNIYERESFFYRGPVLFRQFVNSMICDFRC